ncbi:hypothetical protein IQ07DRAFT_658698 [Pyrenochaeta sp. DS3sAY3a]|nr:hypothetical protein IQ07DRAFT_658698 [Pyrenochaeta sp. DS3sAY3a]
MASLGDPLLNAPDPSLKKQILAVMFGPPGSLSTNQTKNHDSIEVYFKFYRSRCESALHDGGRHALVRTHQDVIDIVIALKAGDTREKIQQELRLKLKRSHDNEDELIDRSIDLAASLWLMIDFGNIQYGFCGRQLQWSGGHLDSCVNQELNTHPSLGHEGVKLQRIFNALNLDRIVGVKILPTANLLDHLRLTDDDTKLYVFHYASILHKQLQNPVFPCGLVDETLRTLALLFPQNESAVKDSYLNLPSFDDLDPQLFECGHLKTDDRQIEGFMFWHDRLVVLKQVFDEATPRTISQWWYDRRNGVQWYTFWVAIVVVSLTLVFGLIQSIEGALQVHLAFHDEKGP